VQKIFRFTGCVFIVANKFKDIRRILGKGGFTAKNNKKLLPLHGSGVFGNL
jgi:hypothetical protein